jgi:hypothetical protein
LGPFLATFEAFSGDICPMEWYECVNDTGYGLVRRVGLVRVLGPVREAGLRVGILYLYNTVLVDCRLVREREAIGW